MNIPANKHLGKLCKRGHDWNNTGKSLRSIDRHCVVCRYEIGKTEKRKHYAKLWELQNKEKRKNIDSKYYKKTKILQEKGVNYIIVIIRKE